LYVDKVIKNTFTIDINGVEIRVYDSSREVGEYLTPTTLVFLHGSPGQISNWKYQLEYFKNYYRVIAYDQRGYGMSDKPKRVSINDYIRDLARVLKTLNIEESNTILIGHSFGGMIAQTYASEHGIKGLVLIGSLVKLKVTLLDKFIWNTPPILWRKLLFTDNPITRRLYRDLFFSSATSENVFKEFMEDNREYIESLPGYVFQYEKHFKDYDATSILPKIKCPTLIIVGKDDKVTPVEQSKQIHKLITNSKLIVIENAGHLVLYEKPEEVNKLIHEFIEQLEKKQAK